MAGFPYLHEMNNETGDDTQWDGGETDNNGLLDFPHYADLYAHKDQAPYSGAYCMRVVVGSTTAIVTEADLNLADNATAWIRFNVFFGHEFTATADEAEASLFELQASGTSIVACGFMVTAATDVINLGIGQLTATSFGCPIERGVWYTVELHCEIDATGSDDGAIDIYVTKDGDQPATAVYATQVGSLTQAEATDGVLGVTDNLTTTTGTILFDNFAHDTVRIYPKPRWPSTVRITQSGHIFVGPGHITSVTIDDEGAGGNSHLHIIDSDRVATDIEANQVFCITSLVASTAYSVQTDISVSKGCYAKLSGTTPYATITFDRAAAYGNTQALRHHGRNG